MIKPMMLRRLGGQDDRRSKARNRQGQSQSQGNQGGRPSPGAGTAAGSSAFASLRQEMDRLFDDFFASPAMHGLRRRPIDADPWRRFQAMFDATSPVVDVNERDKEYQVTAELPGIAEGDLDINLANGVLTIKGEKKQEKIEEKENYHVSERRYGAFQRFVSSTGRRRSGCRQRVLAQRRPDDHRGQAPGRPGQAAQDRGQVGLNEAV